jgi:hypothetical protein
VHYNIVTFRKDVLLPSFSTHKYKYATKSSFRPSFFFICEAHMVSGRGYLSIHFFFFSKEQRPPALTVLTSEAKARWGRQPSFISVYCIINHFSFSDGQTLFFFLPHRQYKTPCGFTQSYS